MKLQIIVLILIGFTLAFAGEMTNDRVFEADQPIHAKMHEIHRNVPTYEIPSDPIDIQTTYYDYMPGSYIANPIHFQKDAVNGGLYVIFHSRETASATRRQYIAYINSDGSLNSVNYLSTSNLSEGYGALDLDFETSDPLYAYHVSFGQPEMTVNGGYDIWHMLQSPGLISTPYLIVDNAEIAGVETPFSDDLFGWPYVFVTKSPTYDDDGSRRLFVFSSNNTTHSTDPSENVLIAWTDYTTTDIETGNISSLEWNYQTLPLLDQYNAGPTWGRYQKGIAVTEDGQIGMIGYLNANDIEEAGSEILVFYNDNFGEGEWQIFEHELAYYVDNPENQDGSDYFDVGDADLYFDLTNSSHPQACFDANGKLHFIGNMVLGYQNDDDEHYLFAYYSFVKEIVFDPANETWDFKDLYPQSTSASATYPYLPWDEDQDGEIDEYSDEGNVMSVLGWPIWWYGWDEAFHENSYKYSVNLDYNYYAAVWQDGLKSRLYNDGGDEDYVNWATVPEIMIAISTDGESWSEPIQLNANETPELEGMMPCYVYPADHIEYIGDGIGRIHLFFLDDNSFGSFIQGQGSNDGGMLKYMAIDIAFTLDSDDMPHATALSLSNYPNPFNPETTIRFDIPDHAQTTLSIYNIKGQRVKTLLDQPMDTGEHHAVWNGTDNLDKPVSSGVYLYRLQSGDHVVTKRMLLMK